VRTLLISTYELGRQPVGLASAAAWLREAGLAVEVCDLSRGSLADPLPDPLDLVAVHLPMHTATRLALPVFDCLRARVPSAHLCAFGLYAPLNADLLRARGVHTVLGPEYEPDLLRLAQRVAGARTAGHPVPAVGAGHPAAGGGEGTRRGPLPRFPFRVPDRSGLPALGRYARLVTPSTPGRGRLVGSAEASRGCKHRCRHCPIVPVYAGRLRVIPVEVVIADIGRQVQQGATHITFGDPDFFNGIGHARRVVAALSRAFPGLTYDVTIKIEHLLRHAADLPLLRDTGCLFVTSAVESIDDAVLGRLAKGHTRADAERAIQACADARLMLAPSFIAFTPWTTPHGYAELLDWVEHWQLVNHVAPVQLTLRLLITAGSLLRDLDEVRALAGAYDGHALVYPWRHADPAVDALQAQVTAWVSAHPRAGRSEAFAALRGIARHGVRGGAGASGGRTRAPGPFAPGTVRSHVEVSWLDEPWYC
jgi:radical SAM superfamily enzyme YgiQ (UPF0313 family)